MPAVAREMFPSITPELFAGSPIEQAYRLTAPNPDDFPTLVEKLKQLDTTPFAWSSDDIRAITAPTCSIVGDSDGVRLEHAVELFGLLGGGVMGDLAGHAAVAARRAAGHVALRAAGLRRAGPRRLAAGDDHRSSSTPRVRDETHGSRAPMGVPTVSDMGISRDHLPRDGAVSGLTPGHDRAGAYAFVWGYVLSCVAWRRGYRFVLVDLAGAVWATRSA